MLRRHRWSLTSGLDGGRWSTQRLGWFTPWKVTSVLVAQEAVWACVSALAERKILPSLRFEPRGVHPVAICHLTTLSLRRVRNIEIHSGKDNGVRVECLLSGSITHSSFRVLHSCIISTNICICTFPCLLYACSTNYLYCFNY
jgi:hypothetical protein